MGKGARNREKNAGVKQHKIEVATQTAKKEKKKSVIISSIAIVLVVAILSTIGVYNFYYENGTYLRKQVVATSESSEVTSTMMLYYMNQSLATLESYYGDYFELITGADLSTSLKDQYYSDTQTWFEYLSTETLEAVEELLVLSDAAYENDYNLSDDNIADIFSRANSLSISNSYINSTDIANSLVLQATATLYRYYIEKDIESEITEEEIEAEYAENAELYQDIDYMRYTLSYVADGEEDELLMSSEEAMYYALILASATTEEEFAQFVKDVELYSNPDSTDEELELAVEDTIITDQTYVSDSEIYEWLFSASDDETYTYTNTDDCYYTVFFVTSAAEKYADATVNSRHIIITADSAGSSEAALELAEEILAEVEASDKSEETFIDLAIKYSDDGNTSYTGGYYDGVPQSGYITECGEWAFDESRVAGDVAIVESDYGYHVMFFEGEGEELWKETVIYNLKTAVYDEFLESLKETYEITVSQEAIDAIPY